MRQNRCQKGFFSFTIFIRPIWKFPLFSRLNVRFLHRSYCSNNHNKWVIFLFLPTIWSVSSGTRHNRSTLYFLWYYKVLPYLGGKSSTFVFPMTLYQCWDRFGLQVSKTISVSVQSKDKFIQLNRNVET